MKKIKMTAAVACVLACSLTFSSCIGSFSLTNKVLSWNKQVGSKFLNELVFFAFWVLPVYEVTALCDVLVINSIEFWSGNNPLSASTKVIDTEQGRYLVVCDGKGYTVTNESTGQEMRLDFIESTQTWQLDYEGKQYPLMTFVDDTHVAMPGSDGKMHNVELTAEGVDSYRSEVAHVSPVMMAAR